MKTQATDGQTSLEQQKEEQAFLKKWGEEWEEEDQTLLKKWEEERIAKDAQTQASVAKVCEFHICICMRISHMCIYSPSFNFSVM